MAAEKLTKARLIQILILMAVLITAFVWRTVTYEENTSIDDSATNCLITAEYCAVDGSNKKLGLSLNPYPVVANSEVTLRISNTNVKPVAKIEGVDMFMGTIPVIFEQQTDYWVGTFSVPDCVHDTMEWAITVQQGSETIIAKFTVQK
ncbi:hypothetical protein BIT28_10800 [Photobacterium proteolyticum]|uniref:YtkA-like domain-containing protein n=1 Tax=Photobacterium proteolyticum TaxID=1903952 RepID=A0A1Q9G6W8_9GAMM|nr:hypothetical protein [Photobacterium proteolyticum]OLQ70021.1 hypothetical protein BIT28_10800 [Photobacterium proteolyticum]